MIFNPNRTTDDLWNLIAPIVGSVAARNLDVGFNMRIPLGGIEPRPTYSATWVGKNGYRFEHATSLDGLIQVVKDAEANSFRPMTLVIDEVTERTRHEAEAGRQS